MEVVPNARRDLHLQYREHRSGLRAPMNFLKKSMATQTSSVQTNTVILGPSLGRPFFRPHAPPSKKVRIVESGSRYLGNRRIQSELEDSTEHLRQSSLESDPPMSRENTPRTSFSDDHGSPSLANSNLVSLTSMTCSPATNLSVSSRHTNHGITNSMASSTTVETLRLEALRSSFTRSGLSDTPSSILRAPRLASSTTNTSYKRGQVLLAEWAISHNVPLTSFTETHLTNFLVKMFETRDYHHSTIYLFRSAITHLHQNPASLRASEIVNAFIKSLKSQALPKQIHRPTIGLGPTLQELRRIDIDSSSTPIIHLQ